MTSSSVAVTSEDSANSNLSTLVAPAEYLLGEVQEPLSGGASTPSGVRPSPKTTRPLPIPVPATARTGGAIRNNRVHRPNVVTRRAAAELTGAVTRYKGVRPNKNNNGDDDDTTNNNHTALMERFHPSTLHKLRQLGIYTITDTPDDNDINNNKPRGSGGTFLAEYAAQAATARYLRQKGHARRQQYLQQQPRGSGGTFPAEYAAQVATTRSLHQHGHARYYISA